MGRGPEGMIIFSGSSVGTPAGTCIEAGLRLSFTLATLVISPLALNDFFFFLACPWIEKPMTSKAAIMNRNKTRRLICVKAHPRPSFRIARNSPKGEMAESLCFLKWQRKMLHIEASISRAIEFEHSITDQAKYRSVFNKFRPCSKNLTMHDLQSPQTAIKSISEIFHRF